MVSKRGDQKYYIIVSLILGLMILAISLYWIFNEFFNEEEIDWEVCRQSILLRAGLPEADLAALKLDAKGAFPLKCKTEVVTIDDFSSPEKVYGKIADTVAQGWYMFGEGKLDFVHRENWESQTVCMVFARIHFDEEAVREFDDDDIVDTWMGYFRERGYGIDPFREGFQDYYSSARVENSEGTYGDYLPIYLTGDPSVEGNLVVNWADVEFNPGMDKDYLLVYRINKVRGITVSSFGGLVTSLVPSWLSGVAWTDEKIKLWQGLKTIAITSVDSLDALGCDKFLTVPA
jgi:hypothetical protein